MTLNTLPKKYNVDFSLPNKKPIKQTDIDYSNKIGRSAVFVHRGNSVEPLSRLNTSSRSVGKGGVNSFFDANSLDRINLSDELAESHRIQTLTTVATFSLPDANSLSMYVYQTDLRFNIAINNEGIGTSIGVSYFNGAFSVLNLTSTFDKEIIYTVIFSKAQGEIAKAWLFEDGVLATSSSFGTSADIVYAAGRGATLGARTFAPTNNLQALSIYQAALFRSRFTDAEAMSYGHDVYQVLKPTTPPVYFPTGVGPALFKPQWAIHANKLINMVQ